MDETNYEEIYDEIERLGNLNDVKERQQATCNGVPPFSPSIYTKTSASCSQKIFSSNVTDERPENTSDLSWFDEQDTTFTLEEYTKVPIWLRAKLLDKTCTKFTSISIRKENDILKMTFTCGDRSYSIDFDKNEELAEQTVKEKNSWMVSRTVQYSNFRNKILCLPKILHAEKISIDSSENMEMEDTLIEALCMRKWTCKIFEYNVVTPMYNGVLIFRLFRMFSPTEMYFNVKLGAPSHITDIYTTPSEKSSSSAHDLRAHIHLRVSLAKSSSCESDARTLLKTLRRKGRKSELKSVVTDIGNSFDSGKKIIRTMRELNSFVYLITHEREDGKRNSLKKFVVRGFYFESDCRKFTKILRNDSEENQENKKGKVSKLEHIYICTRTGGGQLAHKPQCNLSLAFSNFYVPLTNESFLRFTKRTPYFMANFKTFVDAAGIRELVKEWLNGEREIVEMKFHIDAEIDDSFEIFFNCEYSDPKWIKLRRILPNRKSTLYICRNALSSKLLIIKSVDGK